MIAFGFDASFLHFGWAVIRLHPDREQLISLGVIRPKSDKTLERKRDNDQHRGAQLATELLELTRHWRPGVICVEALAHAPVRTRAGSSIPVVATSKSGRAWGQVDMLAALYRCALLQVAPQTIKRVCAGSASASKAEVQAALDERFNGALSRHLRMIRAKSVHEHAVDAVGAVVALLDDPHLRLARAAAGSRQQPLFAPRLDAEALSRDLLELGHGSPSRRAAHERR